MDYLIKLGMTIEETVNHSVFGPPLDTKEAAQQAISAAKENLKLVEVKGKRFQVEKSTSDYRLCFSPLESDPDRSSIDLESGVRCGEKDKVPGAARRHSRAASAEMQKGDIPTHEPGKLSGTELPTGLADALWEELKRALHKLRHDPQTLASTNGRCVQRSLNRHRRPSDAKPTLTLNLRSPEAILFYLGEIVRRYQEPEFGFPRRAIQIKTGPADIPAPKWTCPIKADAAPFRDEASYYSCENVFLVDRGFNQSSISVDYAGQTYWLHDEPRQHSQGGLSLSVLAFIKQLIALNKSVKQLPAASALGVIVSP